MEVNYVSYGFFLDIRNVLTKYVLFSVYFIFYPGISKKYCFLRYFRL